MSKKPYLWKNRPLSDKLIYYAGCDVKYLHKVYDIICKKCEKGINNNIKIENIFEECNKYLKYLEINKEFKNFNRADLNKGKRLSGLIKNFQHKCVFIQLNIGYMGIVTESESVATLKEKYKLGDIADFIIQDFDEKKKRLVLNLYTEKKSSNNLRENLKAIIKRKEREEKMKNNEIGNKLIHEGLNINKKSFYPKNYFNNKYHTINPEVNNIQMMNKNNYYNYNMINNIGNKTFSGHFYFNNYNPPNITNNGFLYNREDNAFYFEPQDENNSSNFYYIINKYQDSYSNKNFHP